MFCRNCGSKLPDDAAYCTYCGIPVSREEKAVVRGSGRSVLEAAGPEDAYASAQKLRSASSDPEYGLKWYEFIVNVQIWISIGFSLASFIFNVYRGFHYKVGMYFVIAVIYLALAAFTYYTRTLLKCFDAKGPRFYIAINIFNAIQSFVFGFIFDVFTGMGDFWSYSVFFFGQFGYPLVFNKDYPSLIMLPLVIGAFIFAGFNICYFSKRKALFSGKNR